MTEDKLAYLRPSFIEVDLDAIRFNVKSIKQRLGDGVKLLAVVKANAYGLGAVEVSRTVSEAGAECLGVAIVEEGIQLREAGISTPILVLYPEPPERAEFFLEYDLIPTVSDQLLLERLNHLCSRSNRMGDLFLKLDSGMGRYGLSPGSLLSLAEKLLRMSKTRLAGLSTNLSDPENGREGYSLEQIETFRKVDRKLRGLGFRDYLRSVANSTAFLDLPESHFDLVRIGHLLYGSYPSEQEASAIPLKSVFALKSRVLLLKEVDCGRPLGYGNSYTTTRLTKIATLPIGYADGVPRQLSNCGQVLIRGQRANIIGRVCMDALMVDVTDIADVQLGDEVVLIGKQGDETITVHEIAKTSGTISYEIISRFSSRLPRICKNLHKTPETVMQAEALREPNVAKKVN
ncbi:MAG: alanine racemase [Candidatus Zixiibacteriota bacterium]